MSGDLRRVRVDYAGEHLREADVPAEPDELFARWISQAFAARDAGLIKEPNAMILATVEESDRGVQAAARAVLLKEYDALGLVFYTNYTSAKAAQLVQHPRATALFYWGPLFRQVRFEGTVTRVTRAESEEYFALRPRAAQVGAWASGQSSQVSGVEELEATYADVAQRFADVEQIPCPPTWGGYRLVPDRIEFWAGQPSRMHDRLVYTRVGEGWAVGRLAP
ncbi:MAG: pyridoxamine 5'-phosphate oxidase [Micropruina sp.]|nr:pyridoxamine 5'-phosphate oxidase [Micropruina sp.]